MGTFNTKLWLLLPGAQGKGFSAGCKLLGGQAQEAPGCSGKFSQGLGERGERTSSSLLPPCPAPAPARTSPCTSTRVTHAGARAPSRQDDAQHIAALSLVSFRKYKGINWLLLEAAWSRCKKHLQLLLGAVTGFCLCVEPVGEPAQPWGFAGESRCHLEQEEQLSFNGMCQGATSGVLMQKPSCSLPFQSTIHIQGKICHWAPSMHSMSCNYIEDVNCHIADPALE